MFVSFLCGMTHSCVCDMTDLYVSSLFHTCMTWLFHTCNTWQVPWGEFVCHGITHLALLIYVYGITHLALLIYVCATWLIRTWHDSSTCVRHDCVIHVILYRLQCVAPCVIHVTLCVRHDCVIHVTTGSLQVLVERVYMTVSYMWHVECIWLCHTCDM